MIGYIFINWNGEVMDIHELENRINNAFERRKKIDGIEFLFYLEKKYPSTSIFNFTPEKLEEVYNSFLVELKDRIQEEIMEDYETYVMLNDGSIQFIEGD